MLTDAAAKADERGDDFAIAMIDTLIEGITVADLKAWLAPMGVRFASSAKRADVVDAVHDALGIADGRFV